MLPGSTRKKMVKNILYIQGVTIMGGAPRSLINLSGGLDKSRFRPIAIVGCEGRLADELEKNGVCVKVVRMGMWRKGKSWFHIPFSLKRIHQIMLDEKIDLVHSNTLWDNPYGTLYAKGIPTICHLRSDIREDMVGKYFLNRTDRLITISNYLRNSLPTSVRGKSITIYNGIDTGLFRSDIASGAVRRKFGIDLDVPLVGMISRLDPLKGQETLIRAASLILKDLPQTKFLLVGEESHKIAGYKEKLESLARRRGVADSFIFTGYQKDVPRITAACDLAVLPSHTEGFGRSLQEAMALKIPVIATRVGGIVELVRDGENGYLMEPNDYQMLAGRAISILSDKNKARNMGEAGYRLVQVSFTMERHIEKIQELYSSMIG